MNKNTKKNTYQLKFDTSKNNLECFIKKKSVSMMESDKNDKKNKNAKSKAKPATKKTQEFQEEKLISSIIKNVMSDEFEDAEQVSDLLNKVQIEGEERNESPTHDDGLLKIFNNTEDKLTPPKQSYFLNIKGLGGSHSPPDRRLMFENKEMEIAFGKEHQWHNFSTEMGTDVDTERSRPEEKVEQYPSLIGEKAELLVTPPSLYEQGQMEYYQTQFVARTCIISNENPYRKSTPIRGDNEKFNIIIDNVTISLPQIEKDERTTVMIRHIPNKYTQQMLIDEINLNNKLKYNFLYLPLDSYNPCNVGYAFINFIDAKFIKKFYLEFNGKRWSKFNSEKICELAYARIQGSTALINHFENSNVMNARDKRIRPFISFGENLSNTR